MSQEAFKRLAKLAVRALYSGKCPPDGYRDDESNESARNKFKLIDTSGLGIILIDYLVEKDGWVTEEDMLLKLKLNLKLMRRALMYLEHEQMIMSSSQRETSRGQKHNTVKLVMKAEAKAMQGGVEQGADEEDEDEERIQTRTYSYFAMDFPRFFDSLQLKLHIMKKTLKDELEDKEVVVRYHCKTCNKFFDSFEVAWLVEPLTGDFTCDLCSNKILPVLASGETGDEAARRQRRAVISARLHKMDVQFRDIHQLVTALASRPLSEVPFCGTLREWAARKLAQQRAGLEGVIARGGGGGGGGGGGRVNQGFNMLVGSAGDFWQETQIEVNLGGGGGGGGGGGARGANGEVLVSPSSHSSAPGIPGQSTGPKRPSSNLPSFLRPTHQTQSANPVSGASGLTGQALKGGAASDPDEERRKAYYAAYMAQLASQQAEREKQARGGLGGQNEESDVKRQRVDEQQVDVAATNEGDDDEWDDV